MLSLAKPERKKFREATKFARNFSYRYDDHPQRMSFCSRWRKPDEHKYSRFFQHNDEAVMENLHVAIALSGKCTWIRKIPLWLSPILILLPIMGCADRPHPREDNRSILVLPSPLSEGQISVEQALRARRSVRGYSRDPLNLTEVSQLLWAAQGLTHPDGLRTAPSAGALYPLDIYLLAGDVADLPTGVYHYRPQDHTLMHISGDDKRQDLFDAALQQSPVKEAALVLVISAVYERTTAKYGDRGVRYVHMEVGHAAQNVYLQAESLALGTVFIGAFHEDEVKAVLQIREEEVPLGLMPVGRKLLPDEETP